ncbi:MAG: hypothetical protein ACTHK6_04485 [Solirubrobacterales bacterium]
MRLVASALLACLCLIAATGCGSQEEATPVACLAGPAAYERALAAAPGEVLLAGKTPISSCLVRNQSGGELAGVGEAMVAAATKLNSEARAEPGGEAAVRLGYLLGAAQRGADRSEGIHSDLVRRLTVAARYAPGKQPLPPAFYRAYRTGYAAGHSEG